MMNFIMVLILGLFYFVGGVVEMQPSQKMEVVQVTEPTVEIETIGEKRVRFMDLQKQRDQVMKGIETVARPVFNFDIEKIMNPELVESDEIKQLRVQWETQKAELHTLQDVIDALAEELELN